MLKTTDPADIPSQELLTLNFPEISETGVVPPIAVGENTAVAGSFKIPSLRNVSLTAPCFHKGGYLTLKQVVQFYNRGGDFHDHVGPGGVAQDEIMDLGIGRLELTDDEIDALVAYLETMTERARRSDQTEVQKDGPNDHPLQRNLSRPDC